MYIYTYIRTFQQSSHVNSAKHARGKEMTTPFNSIADKISGADKIGGKSFNDS